MRLVILKDFKITDDESNELQRQFTDLYYEHAGITPEFFVEKVDYTSVPTEKDSDGDIKPTKAYFKEMTDEVFNRYQEFGTDHVVMLVHEDNWIFKGIWGTNYSNIYHSYHVQLCRFDRDNMANSLGTLYHEVMHSHDALIATTVGFEVDALFGVDYDKYCVHGGRPDKENTTKWKYIRHKENTDALKTIAPYLRQSYAKRKTLYLENVGLMEKLIFIIEKYIVLLRAVNNKKDGVNIT